ncbi:MAG TPA: hypothetical protein VFY18_10010 [Candidatus Limnocylindrales bacterium]|nr:hypothetical protein [Candidatus Limnocylindrales bacterium]
MNEKQLALPDLYLALDRREREFRAMELERSVPRKSRPSVRQSVGLSFVRFGERLSGEANLKPVRSR